MAKLLLLRSERETDAATRVPPDFPLLANVSRCRFCRNFMRQTEPRGPRLRRRRRFHGPLSQAPLAGHAPVVMTMGRQRDCSHLATPGPGEPAGARSLVSSTLAEEDATVHFPSFEFSLLDDWLGHRLEIPRFRIFRMCRLLATICISVYWMLLAVSTTLINAGRDLA